MDIQKPDAPSAIGHQRSKDSSVERVAAIKKVAEISQLNPVTAEKNETVEDDAKNIANAVTEVEGFVQNIQRDLHFSVDKDSGKTVVKVFDSATDDLIRQIPTEEMLAIAKKFAGLTGTFIKIDI